MNSEVPVFPGCIPKDVTYALSVFVDVFKEMSSKWLASFCSKCSTDDLDYSDSLREIELLKKVAKDAEGIDDCGPAQSDGPRKPTVLSSMLHAVQKLFRVPLS